MRPLKQMTMVESIPLGDRCSVTLHRTLRIPDDGRAYPLPPSLGSMTAHRLQHEDYIVPRAAA